MKALFEPFRRFDARRIFGFIRRLGGHVTSKSQVLRFAFYPRPPGGGRLLVITHLKWVVGISIHALRVEGDQAFPPTWSAASGISIHALRVEGDQKQKTRITIPTISIHALRVEGDEHVAPETGRRIISIHALRVEGDEHVAPETGRRIISIHALRVEGDTMLGSACRLKMHFYPRPPGGGRRAKTVRPTALLYFYPRPPGGGRLLLFIFLAFLLCISIHALRVEGDTFSLAVSFNKYYFYPRPPGGGRRAISRSPSYPLLISIHALRVEGDYFGPIGVGVGENFYPRPPGGGRPSKTVTRI